MAVVYLLRGNLRDWIQPNGPPIGLTNNLLSDHLPAKMQRDPWIELLLSGNIFPPIGVRDGVADE